MSLQSRKRAKSIWTGGEKMLCSFEEEPFKLITVGGGGTDCGESVLVPQILSRAAGSRGLSVLVGSTLQSPALCQHPSAVFTNIFESLYSNFQSVVRCWNAIWRLSLWINDGSTVLLFQHLTGSYWIVSFICLMHFDSSWHHPHYWLLFT